MLLQRVMYGDPGRWLASLAGYVAVVASAIGVVVVAVDRLAVAWVHTAPPAKVAVATKIAVPAIETSAPLRVVRHASMLPTQDEWAEKLRDPSFWAKLKSGNSKPASWTKSPAEPRSQLGIPPASTVDRGKPNAPGANSWNNTSDDDTYRTMCVRLCDGAFFPLSFSTSRDNFDADAARCEKTCPGARLYAYKNPGDTLEDMEDQKGQPYRRLAKAFAFRTSYDATCRCRPHPWEEASLTQHRVYALESQSAKGDKIAGKELQELTARLKQAEVAAQAARKQAEADQRGGSKKLADANKGTKGAAKAAAQVAPPAEIKAAAVRQDAASIVTRWSPKPLSIVGSTASTSSPQLRWTPLPVSQSGAPLSRLGGPVAYKPQQPQSRPANGILRR